MAKMKEHQIKDTDYWYILGMSSVIFSNGVTMSLEEFKSFHSKGILTTKIRTLARVPDRLFDYAVALESGILTPKYMPAKLKKLHKSKAKKKTKEAEMEEVAAATLPVPLRKKITPQSRSQVILFTMLFVAIGSAGMSIYHAATFLTQGGKPFFIAAVTSVMLVLFASTGFTAARYFSEQRGFAKLLSVPFIIITTILICYIAFSTTSVSYEQFRDEGANKIAGVNKQIGNLELHKEVKKNIAETEKFIRTLSRTNKKDMTKGAIYRHQRMVASERNKLQKLREKSYALKESSGGGSIAEKQKSITSVYDFLTGLFGINSRILRFIIYVIPAVFYDVVAPFGFTVVFFLADNKPKEQTDET